MKMYDIIIKNASVIDGTASPPFEADLAIKGQKIADVGRLNRNEATLIIDAKRYAVAPGFIDMHSHADFSLPIHPTADSLVHQGITTVGVGQCGLSPAPLVEKSRDQVVSAINGFFGNLAKSIPWNKWASSSPRKKEYEGCYIDELAAQSGKSPYNWLFEALLETELDISMAVFGMSEENRQREIQFSGMMFGTDGIGMATSGPMAKGVPHPRNYRAFPRVLGRFVRDLKVIELEEAIYRMTGLPVGKLRLNDRGLIKPGLAADLVIFDPAEVSDRATYENPHQYAGGIFHVIVNGNLVVQDAAHTGARPGRILKIS